MTQLHRFSVFSTLKKLYVLKSYQKKKSLEIHHQFSVLLKWSTILMRSRELHIFTLQQAKALHLCGGGEAQAHPGAPLVAGRTAGLPTGLRLLVEGVVRATAQVRPARGLLRLKNKLILVLGRFVHRSVLSGSMLGTCSFHYHILKI